MIDLSKLIFGWLPDLPDPRDWLFPAPSRMAVAELPCAHDLVGGFPEVENQGRVGSCTAEAAIGYGEFLDREADGSHEELSSYFAYYNARQLSTPWLLRTLFGVRDTGSSIRDVVKAAARWGFAPLGLWPRDEAKVNRKPSGDAYAAAELRQALHYYRVEPAINALRAAIAGGRPVIFGMPLYQSFVSDEVRRSGIVPMPRPGEREVGGHAMLVVGYNEAGFTLRNSWGRDWGNGGYCRVPAAMARYFRDCWVIESRELP